LYVEEHANEDAVRDDDATTSDDTQLVTSSEHAGAQEEAPEEVANDLSTRTAPLDDAAAEDSVVTVFLVPRLSLRSSAVAQDNFFLGQATVRSDGSLSEEFQLPEWARAGDYVLQINGYTRAGTVRSVNVQLDVYEVREESLTVARVCVFPGNRVALTKECRQSLRALQALMPAGARNLQLSITGVAYGQGSIRKNRTVARERARRLEARMAAMGLQGAVNVAIVTRKGLPPGLTLNPPPVVVTSPKGKPASTVLLAVSWTVTDGIAGAASTRSGSKPSQEGGSISAVLATLVRNVLRSGGAALPR
jgi:hypothetical protein